MIYILLRWLGERGADWVYDFPFALMFEVEFRAFLASFLAFGLCIAAGKPVINTLVRAKIGDTGATDAEQLRAHAAAKANTPTMGGVLIGGAILIASLLLADITVFLVALGLVVLIWLSVLGGFDDWLKLTAQRRDGGRQGLYAWEKLVFQLGIGLLVGIFAYSTGDDPDRANDLAHVLNLPGQRTFVPGGRGIEEGLFYLPPWLFITVAVLLIAGLSNAVNITDGMDGLAGGISAMVSFAVMLLAIVAGEQAYAQALLVPYIEGAGELGVVAGAMAGACVGFLWFNSAPAQVFMGDTGSLSLGGLIAYMALAIRQEFIVLLMCGVFLFEIASVVMQVGYFKATGGKRIFRCAPYHHHLQMGGWPESRVVGRLWIVSILLVILALASIKVR